mgnify:FL=1
MEGDSCTRAAQAAIEVVREECGGMGMEIRGVEDGMFMGIPTEAAGMFGNAANRPVPPGEFQQVVDDSNFIRSWIGGIVASEDVENDPMSTEYANRVYTYAESVFDDPLDFTASDLIGSDALQIVADAA